MYTCSICGIITTGYCNCDNKDNTMLLDQMVGMTIMQVITVYDCFSTVIKHKLYDNASGNIIYVQSVYPTPKSQIKQIIMEKVNETKFLELPDPNIGLQYTIIGN
jgi:hypothetical protein